MLQILGEVIYMLYGQLSAKKLYCVSASDDLLNILRTLDLRNLHTFDYEHVKGQWSPKNSSAVFGIAAHKLGTMCLFGTWMSTRQTLRPVLFTGIDGYVIGELNNNFLVASSIALTTDLKTGIFT